MAQQLINIGAAPNDGTGDTLRDAMDKTNDNFTELYNVGAVESVTGDGVDNTDPDNPVLTFPTPAQIGAPTIAEVAADIQAAIEGLRWKEPVSCATTANITLSGEQTIDGFATSMSRVLVKNQSTASQNGIYVSAAGAWSRSGDADNGVELQGAVVTVQEGSTNANTTWVQTSDGITIGVTSIVWSQFGTSVPDSSETVKGIIEIATQAEVTTGTDDVRTVTPLKLATDTRGIQDIFISAVAMWPRVTSGCAPIAALEVATSLFNVQSLDFDQTTQEFAQCQLVLPRKWNNGTITAVVYWTAVSGSGTVQWGISAGAYSNDDALSVALGTAQTADDTLLATSDLHISPATSAITVAGTPADGDFLAIQISRNPASDTLNADAKLLGISFRITNDSAKDA